MSKPVIGSPSIYVRRALRGKAYKWPARYVLFYLASRMSPRDGRQTCWPSIGTIARDTGLGKTTVKAGLKELRNDPQPLVSISKHRTKGGRPFNVYELIANPVAYSKVVQQRRQQPAVVASRELRAVGSAGFYDGLRFQAPPAERARLNALWTTAFAGFPRGYGSPALSAMVGRFRTGISGSLRVRVQGQWLEFPAEPGMAY